MRTGAGDRGDRARGAAGRGQREIVDPEGFRGSQIDRVGDAGRRRRSIRIAGAGAAAWRLGLDRDCKWGRGCAIVVDLIGGLGGNVVNTRRKRGGNLHGEIAVLVNQGFTQLLSVFIKLDIAAGFAGPHDEGIWIAGEAVGLGGAAVGRRRQSCQDGCRRWGRIDDKSPGCRGSTSRGVGGGRRQDIRSVLYRGNIRVLNINRPLVFHVAGIARYEMFGAERGLPVERNDNLCAVGNRGSTADFGLP